MNANDLSTGKREIGGGLERYTFQMPSHIFKRKDLTPYVVRQYIADLYMLSPRPDPREIIDVKVKLEGKNRAVVTLTIQRGHYLLAELLREHEELTFYREEGYATCLCHPGSRHPLVMNSIPNYRSEFSNS